MTNHTSVNKAFFFLTTLWIFFYTASGLNAQRLIWPGDIDNNGRVEHVDVLYLGYVYGYTGPPRPEGNQKTDFVGYPAPEDWESEFVHIGLNANFADANGDGVVDDKDLSACYNNYPKGQGAYFPYDFIQGNETRPTLEIIPDRASISGGEKLNLTFSLGSPEQQIDSIYGIAFRFTYDTAYVVETGIDTVFFPTDSWFVESENPLEDEAIIYVQDHPEKGGVAYITVVRKNQKSRVADGPIVTATIVIETVIIGPKDVNSFKFGVDSVMVIDNEFLEIPVGWGEGEIINLATVTNTKQVNTKVEPRIYPNPTSDRFSFSISQSAQPIDRLRLYDILGKEYTVPLFRLNQRRFEVSSAGLPPGLYLVVAEANNELYTTNLLIK